MKRSLSIIIAASFIMMVSCTTTKDIVYLQNIDEVTMQEIVTRYEAKIKKDDILSIIVSGPDKQVVMPYNLTLSDNTVGGSTTDPEKSTLSYLVDAYGDINFPILGIIHVEGMTRSELVTYLTDKIKEDVKDPIVYVSFRNYKITVIGEVRNPGTYTMDSEKITIFQALGRAGDLNLTAKREGILLIREVDGINTYYTIDLKSAELMNEPYFFIQQNDVLYVPPSEKRIRAATTNTAIWGVGLSSVATLISAITLIVTLTK